MFRLIVQRKPAFFFALLATPIAFSTATACDNFDRTACSKLGEDIRNWETRTGETVPVSLYDPTWFVASSDCWTTTIERANQCGMECVRFAERFAEIKAEYNRANNGDGGVADAGS